MNQWLSSPFFGISLSIAAFAAGVFIQKILKTPIANPVLIAIALIVAVLNIFSISYENYNVGGSIITMLLIPATALLALSVYNRLDILKKNFLPVVAGCLTGSVVSIASVLLLCRLFGLDDALTASLIPKSATMPIAVSISEQHGGLVSVTVAAVIITGLFGAVSAPQLVRLFRIKDPVTAGVAIGTSSHVGGTSKAIEMGQVEGAVSSVSIGIAGLIITFISMFL